MVTQPTFADSKALIQVVFDHLPALAKQGGSALERAVQLFVRLGTPPPPWMGPWIKTLVQLVKAVRGHPLATVFLLGTLPASLSPDLMSHLSGKERLEAAALVESLSLDFDWKDLERLHVLQCMLHQPCLLSHALRPRVELTRVALSVMLRAEAPPVRLPPSLCQLWVTTCLELARDHAWRAQAVITLCQALRLALVSGHSLRAIIALSSPLWSAERQISLNTEQWAQILLAFSPKLPWKNPDPAFLEILNLGLDAIRSHEPEQAPSDVLLHVLRALEAGVTSLLRACPPKSRAGEAAQAIALKMSAVLIGQGAPRTVALGMELWEPLLPTGMQTRRAETMQLLLDTVERLAKRLPAELNTIHPILLTCLVQIITFLAGNSPAEVLRFCSEMDAVVHAPGPLVFCPLLLIVHALPWAISKHSWRSAEGLQALSALAALLRPAWLRTRPRAGEKQGEQALSDLMAVTLERVARLLTQAEPEQRSLLVPLLRTCCAAISVDESLELRALCWRKVTGALCTLNQDDQVAVAQEIRQAGPVGAENTPAEELQERSASGPADA